MYFAFAVNYFPIQQTNFHMTDTVIGKTSRLFLLNMKHASSNHIEAYKWLIKNKRLIVNSKGASLQEMHWRGVLERLLAIVRFQAQNNMAFRGTEEWLDSPSNGNLLGLYTSKLDPVLQEHVRLMKFTRSLLR